MPDLSPDLLAKLAAQGITIPTAVPPAFSAVPAGSFPDAPPPLPPPVSPGLAQQLAVRGITVPGLNAAAIPQRPTVNVPAPLASVGGEDFSQMGPMTDEQARRAGFNPARPSNVDTSSIDNTAAKKVEGVFNDQPGGSKEVPLVLPKPTAAHWQSKVSPETRRMFGEGFGEEREGMVEEGQASAKANEIGADALDRQAAAVQKMALDSQLSERVRQDALNQQADEYRTLQKEAAQGQIDPNRWEGEHSKALATVAQALGAFGSGLTHGRNPNWAADLIQSRIRENIDAQKENLANKHKSVEEAGSLYAQKLRQYGDERSAELATHATLIEQYKLTAQAEAARAQSPVMIAKSKALVGQLDVEQAKLHAQLEALVSSGGMTRDQQDKLIAFTKENMDKGMSAADAQKAAQASVFQQPGVFAGTVPVKGAAGQLPEAAVLGEPVKSTAAELSKPSTWLNPILRNIPGTDEKREVLHQQQQAAPIMGYAHKAYGARTPEAQREIMGPFIPDPADTPARLAQKRAGLKKLLEAQKGGTFTGDVDDYLQPESED